MWVDSRGKLIVLLGIIWILAIVHLPTVISIVHPLSAIICTIFFDILFAWVRRRKIFFSPSSIVTGLLIGLLNLGGLEAIVLASFIAASSKQFVQQNNRHVFNPAAIGLLISSLFLNEPIDWWAVSWGFIPVVILVLWMIPILWKMKRLWMPVTFLIVYFISTIMFQNIDAAIRLTLDGTVFLFVFVMLPEPMTSVNRGRWQYVWGILVGLLVVGETLLGISWGDPLLLALLGANFIGLMMTNITPSIRTALH